MAGSVLYPWVTLGGPNALLTSLISYWKLDEASGNALDAIGSNTLTDTNTVTSGSGIINTARQFTAANSETLTIVDNASLSTGDIDFTITAWVNLTSKPDQAFVCKGAGSTFEYELYYGSGSDTFHWYVENGGSHIDLQATSFGSPSISTWYFLVAWHDSVANTVNIQVNNGTVNSTAYSSGSVDSAQPFYIGSEGGTGLFTNGLIDEVGFWKRVLSAGDRTLLYNSGTGLPFSSFS